MDAVKPYLMASVQNVQSGDACFAAVGCVGDICRQLGEACEPYCDEFMGNLLGALTVSDIHLCLHQ